MLHLTYADCAGTRYPLRPHPRRPPAVQAHLARWPEAAAITSRDELPALAHLLSRFVPIADALLAYASVVGGVRLPN